MSRRVSSGIIRPYRHSEKWPLWLEVLGGVTCFLGTLAVFFGPLFADRTHRPIEGWMIWITIGGIAAIVFGLILIRPGRQD